MNLVSRFVGRISMFVEMWRYDSTFGKMIQSGERVILLPPTSPTLQIAQPVITFTRMDFGFEPRAPHEGPNEFHFPLVDLAVRVTGPARVSVAYQRYLERGKQRRRRGGNFRAGMDQDYNEADGVMN